MGSIFEKFMKENPVEAEKALDQMSAERKRMLEEIKRKAKEEEERKQKLLDDLYDDKKPNEDGELPPYWQH